MASLTALTLEEESEWTGVVERAWRHDVYHLPAYHRLAQRQGEGDPRLFVYREGEIEISIPLLLRPLEALDASLPSGVAWCDATSVYGYPGPLQTHEHVPREIVRGFHSALRKACLDLHVVSVFSRLNPCIPQTHLLTGLGECPMLGHTVSVDLDRPSEVVWRGYRENHRRHIKRNAKAGIVCFHDTDFAHLDAFRCMYYETMRRVEADSSYFFDREYFVDLVEDLGGRVHLFVALLENRAICGGLFTVCDGIVQYHLGGTLDEYLHLSPLKSVVDCVRVWAASGGARVLHLGGGMGARDDALLAFKAGFSDSILPFHVWKWVADGDMYAALSGPLSREPEGAAADRDDRYFPAYRAPRQRPIA